MFTSAKRIGSHGVRDAAELLLIWSVKNIGRQEYGKRSYHNILKRNLFPQVNTLFGRNKIQFNYIKCSASNIKYALSTSTVLHENRSAEVQEFYKQHSITITGKDPVSPYLSLEEAGFPQDIATVLRNSNINKPTPIQSLSWPHALAGRDFIGVSKTGSGKTLGFIIPIVIHIRKMKETNSMDNLPLSLVLVPTRELAQQIENVVKPFTNKHLRCVCLYGGAPKERQFREITKGVDLCIATPGRILDFISSGVLSLHQCSFLVLDEADRMLDMGFLPDMESIVNTIECKKQVLMWSATWPKEVKNVASQFLSDYIMITVGSTELKPNPNVRQIVKVVGAAEKNQKLLDLIENIQSEKGDSKLLIFVNTKFGVDCLEHFLRSKRIKVDSIHSGKTQVRRESTLRGFRDGRFTVLLATAVAARGLDIDNISHVINYDCPAYYEEYIHKIGRTARHEKIGTAITFVTPADTNSSYLLDTLRESKEPIPQELYAIGQNRQLEFNAFHGKKKHFKGSGRNDWY